MQEIEDGGGNKKKDFFWLVIIVGIVVVTVGALFTGNYLARVFLTDDEAGVVINDTTETAADGVYLEPETGEPEDEAAEPAAEEVAAPPITSEKPVNETEKPDAPAAASAPKPAPAPEPSSEISIKQVKTATPPPAQVETPAQAEAPKPAVQDVEIAAEAAGEDSPPPDVKPVAVDPTEEPPAADENVIYVLQLGVYGNKDNALRMKKELEDEYKLEVYVAEVIHEGETRYRVQAGAFSQRENAEKLGRELQIKGYKFYISKQPMPN